jgi:hypothetical protein
MSRVRVHAQRFRRPWHRCQQASANCHATPSPWPPCPLWPPADQQCMGRWRRHLDPSIKRDGWEEEEDEQLRELYGEYGECGGGEGGEGRESMLCVARVSCRCCLDRQRGLRWGICLLRLRCPFCLPARLLAWARLRLPACLPGLPSLSACLCSAQPHPLCTALTVHAPPAAGSSWSCISKSMHGRTAQQCRARWCQLTNAEVRFDSAATACLPAAAAPPFCCCSAAGVLLRSCCATPLIEPHPDLPHPAALPCFSCCSGPAAPLLHAARATAR